MAQIRTRRRKDGGRSYLIRWDCPIECRRRSVTLRDEPTAYAWKAQIEAATARGERWEPPRPGGAAPVEDVTRAYLVDRVTRGTLAPTTARTRASHLDILQEGLRTLNPRREWRVIHLNRDVLDRLWVWLRSPESARRGERRTDRSALNVIRVLIDVWRWAYNRRAELGEVPPVPDWRVRVAPPQRARAATWSQVDDLVAALRAPSRYAVCREGAARLVLLIRYTGLRYDAALKAQTDWICGEPGARWLDVPAAATKGAHGARLIPLHPALEAELQAWGVLNEPGPIARGRNGLGRPRDMALSAWKRTGTPADVYSWRPLHVIRHTLRTHLVLSGQHPDVIDALLGHQGRGTGARTYTDRLSLLPALRRAVATIPPHTTAAGGEE